MLRMYALIQHMRKTDTKLNEMRCHALRKMWTTIPSADAHFAGPVTSKMDLWFWNNHMYTFIAFNYFCYKCIPGTDLSGFFWAGSPFLAFTFDPFSLPLHSLKVQAVTFSPLFTESERMRCLVTLQTSKRQRICHW